LEERVLVLMLLDDLRVIGEKEGRKFLVHLRLRREGALGDCRVSVELAV
jgi:hypothetical protein